VIAFGAELELLGPDGLRTVSLEDFFADDGIVRFKRKSDEEFLVGVRIPEAAQGLKSAYAKLRIRDSIDFPSLGVCVAYRLGNDGTLADLRVGTTALRSRPERHDSVTDAFIGRAPSPELATEIGEVIRKDVAAYRNVPLDPKYRRKMVAVFVRRSLGRLDAAWTE
jgi:CO/xanthine dehydrogenase FAD-binding subunit